MECIVAKWEQKEGNVLTANDLIRVSKNPEYGSLMLIASMMVLNGGFANRRRKIGFIGGSIADLEYMISKYGLEAGTDYSAAYEDVKIITIEMLKSEVPEKSGFKDKINPSTKEILKHKGEVIMIKTQVVSEESDMKDVFIEHDKDGLIRSVVPLEKDDIHVRIEKKEDQ